MKLVICIGFIRQSAISRRFYWEPTTADAFICKAIWMSSASASTAETQLISYFSVLPGLLLHLVPCCVKSISIKDKKAMLEHSDDFTKMYVVKGEYEISPNTT